MDTRTGEIMGAQALEKKMGVKTFRQYGKPVDAKGLSKRKQRQLERTGRTKIGPNAKCPCKSGNKFKRCCGKIPPEPPKPRTVTRAQRRGGPSMLSAFMGIATAAEMEHTKF